MRKSTVIRAVNKLRSIGYEISVRKRSDGGYIITKINGQRFTGAKGNRVARSLSGTHLSAKVYKENRRIVKQFIVKPKLSKSFMREFRKTQRIWNKAKPKGGGKISMKTYRWKISNEGMETAMKSLGEHQRYARGLAYTENINTFMGKMDNIKSHLDNPAQKQKIEAIQKYVRRHGGKITEEQMRNVFYALISEKDMNGDPISLDESLDKIMEIFGITI